MSHDIAYNKFVKLHTIPHGFLLLLQTNILQMTLREINNPKILTHNFQSQDDRVINKTLSCLEELFKWKFVEHGKNVCKRWPSAKNKHNEITEIAFNDGLFSFFLKIKQDGFEERGLSVEDVLKAFFFSKLRGQLTKIYRESVRASGRDPDLVFANMESDFSIFKQPGEEEYSRKEAIFEKAYNKLKEKCKDLIAWRKLLNLKNEEIASRTGLHPNSVNNEVFKCMTHLKRIVNG